MERKKAALLLFTPPMRGFVLPQGLFLGVLAFLTMFSVLSEVRVALEEVPIRADIGASAASIGVGYSYSSQFSSVSSALCGNGVRDVGNGEQCDGADLGATTTCEQAVGEPYHGTLTCAVNCQYNTSLCIMGSVGSASSAPVCGNSVVEAGEQCDDGNTSNGDGCSATCQNEPASSSSAPAASSVPVASSSVASVACSYTVTVTLDWNDQSDLDLYVKNVTDGGVTFYGDASGAGVTLNHDASPSCNATPADPEIATGTFAGGDKTFQVWYNQFSACLSENISPTMAFTVLNTGSDTIGLNATPVVSGDTLTIGAFADAGYANGNQSAYVSGTSFAVTCGAPPASSVASSAPSSVASSIASSVDSSVASSASSVVVGCGNNIKEGAEQCDGTDKGAATCSNLVAGRFDGGTLGCNVDCTYNTVLCTKCGNGYVEGGESCDGVDFAGQSCTPGPLNCNANCTLNTTHCSQATAVCGNGIVEAPEDCELPGTGSCDATCHLQRGIGGSPFRPPTSAPGSTASSVGNNTPANALMVYCCDAAHTDWYQVPFATAFTGENSCPGGVKFTAPDPSRDVCNPPVVNSCEQCGNCGSRTILGLCFASNCTGPCTFEATGLGLTGICRPNPASCPYCCGADGLKRRDLNTCLSQGREISFAEPPPFQCGTSPSNSNGSSRL